MPSLFVVVPAELCGSFFSFASFRVRAMTGLMASLAGDNSMSVDVYRVHLEEGFEVFCSVLLALAKLLSRGCIYAFGGYGLIYCI